MSIIFIYYFPKIATDVIHMYNIGDNLEIYKHNISLLHLLKCFSILYYIISFQTHATDVMYNIGNDLQAYRMPVVSMWEADLLLLFQ